MLHKLIDGCNIATCVQAPASRKLLSFIVKIQ